ncbi:hypothetical protein ACFV9C_33660 [Kribbella sp. NPDC059898]
MKVVVGIDGRPDCENALRWAAAEAAGSVSQTMLHQAPCPVAVIPQAH